MFTRHTPLVGLPGRLGTSARPGRHPGPLSFYLLAPVYRLLGQTHWSLEVGSALIQSAAIGGALWIGYRRGRSLGVLAIGTGMVVAVHMFGQVSLTHPWNPHLPLLAWMVVLLATWSVFCGDTWMVVPLVAAASYCAQGHISYAARSRSVSPARPWCSSPWSAGVGPSWPR